MEMLESLKNSEDATIAAEPFPHVAHFGDVRAEYDSIAQGAGIWHRTDRALLRVTGADRVDWLHNLCTQNLRELAPGSGHYAFFTNVKGRILFDAIVLADAEALWIDLDRRWLRSAVDHLNKYIIVEDVALADASEESVRFAVMGPKCRNVLGSIFKDAPTETTPLQHGVAKFENVDVHWVRHDLCGRPGFEWWVPAPQGEAAWRALRGQAVDSGISPVGFDAVNIHRIEAGIPWPVCEITEDVLPAETGQFERAVNWTKGCYLGQEIIERMRSRGSVARSLVGLRLEDHPQLQDSEAGSHTRPLHRDGKECGRLTSACLSPAIGSWIGLGLVRVSDAEPETQLEVIVGDRPIPAHVVQLPFVTQTS